MAGVELNHPAPTVATTGQDVAAETAGFNEKLAETLAAVPKAYEVDDAVALRVGFGVLS